MASKMATVDKAQELLEKLRRASWDAAVQGSIRCVSDLMFASCYKLYVVFLINLY